MGQGWEQQRKPHLQLLNVPRASVRMQLQRGCVLQQTGQKQEVPRAQQELTHQVEELKQPLEADPVLRAFVRMQLQLACEPWLGCLLATLLLLLLLLLPPFAAMVEHALLFPLLRVDGMLLLLARPRTFPWLLVVLVVRMLEELLLNRLVLVLMPVPVMVQQW